MERSDCTYGAILNKDVLLLPVVSVAYTPASLHRSLIPTFVMLDLRIGPCYFLPLTG